MAQATMPEWIQQLQQRDPKFAETVLANRARPQRWAIPAKYKILMTRSSMPSLLIPTAAPTSPTAPRAAGATEAQINEAVPSGLSLRGTPALVTAVNASAPLRK